MRLLRSQAERAIASVIEAESPLCNFQLRIHDDGARCPGCGDSYVVTARLEVGKCPKHGVTCSHLKAVVTRSLPATD